VVTLVEIIPIVVGEEALLAMEEITGITAGAAQALVALMVAPVRWKLILTILMIATGLPPLPRLFVLMGRREVVRMWTQAILAEHKLVLGEHGRGRVRDFRSGMSVGGLVRVGRVELQQLLVVLKRVLVLVAVARMEVIASRRHRFAIL